MAKPRETCKRGHSDWYIAKGRRWCKVCKYESIKRSHKNTRLEVLNHYGSSCQCCGESRYEFLSLDHINGGGNQHKQREGFTRLFYWLKRNNFPEGYRVLCHNCNQSLGAYGYCPHQGGGS